MCAHGGTGRAVGGRREDSEMELRRAQGILWDPGEWFAAIKFFTNGPLYAQLGLGGGGGGVTK